MIADDEADQTVTPDAFELRRFIAAKRLIHERLVVLDSTNVRASARARVAELAHDYGVPLIAIVLHLPLEECIKRDKARPHRQVGADVVAQQYGAMLDSLPSLSSEGFDRVHVLASPDIESVEFSRVPLLR